MTYNEIKEITKGMNLPVMGENELGEPVMVDKDRDENGVYFDIQTFQNNGWTKVNYVYEDGTITETYEK